MGRLLLAAAIAAGTAGIAAAGPTRKVRVETTPPGATVYIGDVENGAACETTPCTIELPLGENALIVRLDKYTPEFVPVTVPKGKAPIPVNVKLKDASGYISINSPKGASVRINDEDQGKVPVHVKVAAEPARVQVKQDGKVLFDDFVDVEVGGDAEVKVKAGGVADRGGGGDDGGDTEGDTEGGEGDGNGDGDHGDKGSGGAPGTPPAAREPYLQGGLAFDVGFRRFRFSDGSTPFANSGELLLGPAVEVWPGRLAAVRQLRNLSLFARVQFGLTHQKVTRDNMGTPEDVGAETFSGAMEVSVRQKWVFAQLVGAELSGGYVRDQVEFNAVNDTVLLQVPSADYHSIRIGARVSLARPIEPYLSVENRIVLSAGNLGSRKAGTKESGYALAAGVTAHFGPLGARVEGSFAKYSYDFDATSGMPPAATDKLFGIMFLVGYQY